MTSDRIAGGAVCAMALVWAATFSWLALARHFAGGSHAEDLGFTDQVLWNFLPPRLQWFRMSIYAGATWNTELDLSRILRPDSLMAFHFEPLLLLLLPLYAAGGIAALLLLQSLALAAGAWPAYRLGRHAAHSALVGAAVAAAYLLAPMGQWVALSDFHTTALAAPLLLLAVERLIVARKAGQALAAAALAATAREDVGLAVAALGVTALIASWFAARRARRVSADASMPDPMRNSTAAGLTAAGPTAAGPTATGPTAVGPTAVGLMVAGLMVAGLTAARWLTLRARNPVDRRGPKPPKTPVVATAPLPIGASGASAAGRNQQGAYPAVTVWSDSVGAPSVAAAVTESTALTTALATGTETHRPSNARPSTTLDPTRASDLARSRASAAEDSQQASSSRTAEQPQRASTSRTADHPRQASAVSTAEHRQRASTVDSPPAWQTGGALLAVGLGMTCLGVLVIRAYSGGVSPFDVRYASALSANGVAGLLGRQPVTEYLTTLVASGGWLGLLAPLALLPALPALAINVLSSSAWMAAGEAHYSAIVLPFIAIGAAAGLGRLARAKPSLILPATGALLLFSTLEYVAAGAGPLGGNFAPATVTDHARHAADLAASLPATATVSASTALVPRLSQRPHMYVFPAILDADYIFLDLHSTPAPTSAGDVYLRVHDLLATGGWQIDATVDGLVLLERSPDAPPTDIGELAAALAATDDRTTDGDREDRLPTAGGASRMANPSAVALDTAVDATATSMPPAATSAATVSAPTTAAAPSATLNPTDRTDPQIARALRSATLLPSPDGAIDVDGPRWILRTVWQTDAPLPAGTRLDFLIHLRDGRALHAWDVADLWWNPPDQWPPHHSIVIDVPDVPQRDFLSFEPRLATASP